MRWMVVVVGLAACGRIGFDATIDSQAEAGSGSSGGSGSGSDASVDAQPSACAEAIPITVGTPMTISTCSGNHDRLDGCGPAGTNEVVFSLAVPTTRGYNVRAYNTGTTNISNSTGVVDGGVCSGTGQCSGLLGRTFTAGTVVYFAVEASAGGCATIDFLVD